jgi:hypothetical protein
MDTCGNFTLSLPPISVKDVMTEENFFHELKREEQRARRARRPLSLILIDISRAKGPQSSIAKAIRNTIHTRTRTTEICGLIKNETVTAVVIPTECNLEDADAALQIVKARILQHLKDLAGQEVTDSVKITDYLVQPDEMGKFFHKLYADYTTLPS